MNNCVLIGRLCADPELRYVPVSGRAVTNFRIAVDKGLSKERRQEMEAKNQPTADFINIVVWGNIAENCAKYLAKGRLVAVQGRIQTGTYDDKDGNRRYTFDVVANSVEFLEFGEPKEKSEGQKNNDDFGDIEGFHPTDSDDIPF